MLNASNGRFYLLSLGNGAPFQQIGTDQGLLPAPVALSQLVIAPGERADIVVDFAEHRGERIVLQNFPSPLMQFRASRSNGLRTRAPSHKHSGLSRRLPRAVRSGPEDSHSRKWTMRAANP